MISKTYFLLFTNNLNGIDLPLKRNSGKNGRPTIAEAVTVTSSKKKLA